VDTLIGKLIEQLNSSIFILLAVLFAIGFLLWKTSAFMATWQHKQADHEKKLDKVNETNDKVIALETNIGKSVEFGERIVRMETKLDLIFQKLTPNPFAQAQSPIALTKDGNEVAQKINVEATIARLYPNLIELVEKKSPQTAYDIQECAFAVTRDKLFSWLSEAELTALKNEAFNKGMPVDSFSIIYGIVLRDRILASKNIPASDVDLHTPP
jgi:hypothetical protein